MLIFTLFCFIKMGLCVAQEDSSPVIIGINHTIKSSILNQDRTIQIYVPEDYSDSTQDYPVLYILDGQWYFLSGVAIQAAMKTPRAIPEMIVIGINTSNPLREELFGDENEKFTDFLVKEVIYYVDSNYRTSNERVIFGWESAAYYLSDLILQQSEIIDGAIITDGGYASEDKVKSFTSKKDIYLFMANSKKDIYYISSTDAFHQVLKNHAPPNLIWKYSLFNDEFHESLGHLALYKGLKYFYHNYNSPVFESIQQYIDLGGMNYLTTYFKERSERFGTDKQIDNSTKDALIWLAWKRDNFEYFTLFMTEFKDVLSTKRYASAYWQNRFGQFYLKHKDYQNAIKYFNAGLAKYPNSQFEKEMQKGRIDAKNGTD
ncbi:alpha/beta hydrolase-fold protein [Aquimarina sp. LLG6339-5]|uniref:alpha/beta hydrolase-fold protein n=1 Tax=Aquimarina sp. LLG6339-5 TaxID=3160830 RepID=UPI00386EFE09